MRVKRKTVSTPTKVIGYGYVGRWCDGTLGWAMTDHVDGRYGGLGSPKDVPWTRDSEQNAVLCRITVEQVFNRDGRAITRRFPVWRSEGETG